MPLIAGVRRSCSWKSFLHFFKIKKEKAQTIASIQINLRDVRFVLTSDSQSLHWSRSQDSSKPRNSTVSRSLLLLECMLALLLYKWVVLLLLLPLLSMNLPPARFSLVPFPLSLAFGTILMISRLWLGACSKISAPNSSYTSGVILELAAKQKWLKSTSNLLISITRGITWKYNQLTANNRQISPSPLWKYQPFQQLHRTRPQNSPAHGDLGRTDVEPKQVLQLGVDSETGSTRFVQIAQCLKEFLLN